MNPKKVHLLNIARKALFQRAQLARTLGGARQQFAPTALKQRARKQVKKTVDGGVAAAEVGLRKYRLPLGLAALAGLAFAFRRPLAEATAKVANFLERQNADAASAPSPDFPEHDDEPV
jgi:hypothetical protein